MRKYGYLFFVLAVFIAGCATFKDGIKKTYYKNGQINQEWNYRENVFHKYYEDGALQTQGNLKYGKEDGLWKMYYHSGKLFQEINFISGKWNGSCKQYYEDGAILTDGKFIMDKPVGFRTTYFQNGKVHQSWDYKSSKYKEFSENGEILIEKDIK